MVISGEKDNQTPVTAPITDVKLDLRSSIRRRLISGATAAAAAVAPESSAKMTLANDENSITESVGGDTNSDAESRYPFGSGSGEEERKGETEMNGGGARGDGTGKGGRESPAKFVYRASAPAHRRVKESPLSSDAIFTQSHAGLLNLCIVVLIAVNSRLIIENLMKYGLLIRAGFWFSSRSLRDWPLLMCCFTLPAFPLGAYVVEKLAWNKLISESVTLFLHIILTMTEILYPVFVIISCDSAIFSGVALMLIASTLWLKLVSFAHTNYDLRTLLISKGETVSECPSFDYQDGVSFQSLAYFMVAPTLCYQPAYPQTTCIRRGWVIRQFVKLVIFIGVMGFIIEQNFTVHQSNC